MDKPIIKILDAVHCRANKHARNIIKRCLQYKSSAFKPAKNGFGREMQVTRHFLITGNKNTSGRFETGLLPKVLKYARSKGHKITVKGRDNIDRIRPANKPYLEGITFREDQIKALRSIRRRQRGRVVFPTGSGKTIIALGIMSMFPQCRILFLCHTKDLIEQTKEELETYGFNNFYIIGGGRKVNNKQILEHDNVIVLATIQTLSKYADIFSAFFDITIVDEMHHVNSKNSQYGKLMLMNLSPRRYGLTGTLPTKTYEQLINEGIFGPVIAEMAIQEGVEKGILAMPKVNLVSVPYDVNINKRSKNKYANFYEYGIVKNRQRNQVLVNEVKNGEVTLIIIERTDHGEILRRMFKKAGKNVPFVHGGTGRETRFKIRDRMKKGRVKIAICSKVWKEGINIPALNHIIIAHGMREEKMVLQAAGRGLRTAKGKDTIKITDFLDPYRYLAEHTIARIQVYKSKGWL